MVLTIHQPSSALYACFDRLLLLFHLDILARISSKSKFKFVSSSSEMTNRQSLPHPISLIGRKRQTSCCAKSAVGVDRCS